jgi:putative flippase GtrA
VTTHVSTALDPVGPAGQENAPAGPAAPARPARRPRRTPTGAGRFVLAGGACVALAVGADTALIRLVGASPNLAAGIALVLAAAVSFVLNDRWTFAARRRAATAPVPVIVRAARYAAAAAVTAAAYAVLLAGTGPAVAALAVAARVTGLTPSGGFWAPVTQDRVAGAAALILAAVLAWWLQSRLVFRVRRVRPDREVEPGSPDELRALAGGGIAWFLPAHDEAGNLRVVTDRLVTTLRELGARFKVIIVNDGSRDGTEVVAAGLAASYPEVSVVTHETNLGYGPALRTGLEAACATGYELVGFYDADDQFRPHSLLALLTRMGQTGADLVMGVRIKRADGGLRSINGKLWGAVSQRLLRYRAADTDAGCKLLRRPAAAAVLPHLDARRGAGISPQLLSYAQNLGFASAETGVRHYPRTAGRNTGNDLRVIVRSFVDLARTRVRLLRELRDRGLARAGVRADTVAVAGLASALSITAYLHFYPGGKTIAYGDAVSHLLIARRVFDADTPGAGQLGGVWLPLPHLLMLPLVWNSWAYYSGFAGSVVMMLAYVVATVLIYKFVWRLTGRRWAAACGAAVFALNPNILYMQSTPMTELLMFVTMIGAAYGVLRWVQTDDTDRFHHLYLLGAGLSALLCALTRYEGWTLAVTLAGVVLWCSLGRLGWPARLTVTGFVTASVLAAGLCFARFGALGLLAVPLAAAVYAGLRRRYPGHEWAVTEGQLIAFGILGASGPLAWMIWNWTIFGNPLAFQSGPFAKPSLWVDSGEKAVHNIVISLRTYEIATVDNLTPVIATLALAGLVVYLWRTRLSEESLPALALLVMFPMFVVTLYKGERPLHVYQYYDNYYNVRFGLVMILPAAIMTGYLAAWLGGVASRWLRARGRAPARALPALALIAGQALIAVAALGSGRIVTLMEPLAARSTPTAQHARAAADWLRAHYAGGLLLMESYGNESLSFESHVPAQDQVYEGSYRLWQPALANPAGHHIAWIVMRTERGDADLVDRSLAGSTLIDGYRRVWSDADYDIYASRRVAARLRASREGR